MFSNVRFIIVMIFTIFAVSMVAIAWPKLTVEPRPGPLAYIYDLVKNTAWGRQASQVLGVSDTAVEPLNLSAIGKNVTDSLAESVQNQIQSQISGIVTKQLMHQYDNLPDREKKLLKEQICKPSPAP